MFDTRNTSLKPSRQGRIARVFANFRGEAGGVTIESVLWLPFFVVLLTILADFAFVFHGQARALEVIQDANREFSTGTLTTATQTDSYIEQRLASLAPNAKATTTEDNGLILTSVSIPATDLVAVDFFPPLFAFSLMVTGQMFMEN